MRRERGARPSLVRTGKLAPGKLYPAEDDYLVTIFKAQQGDRPVSTTVLTHQLELARSSVSEMLKHLARKQLVEYRPYKGVTLTDIGRRKAARLVRCHRLAERFLTDILGLSWEYAHEEAHKLEHVMSPLVEERMSTVLKNPRTCPHGHPLPDAEGRMEVEPTVPLSQLQPGDRGEVVLIAQETRELLRYLGELGLFPGTSLRIEAVAPFQGPITLTTDRRQLTLGRDVAEMVLVKKDEG